MTIVYYKVSRKKLMEFVYDVLIEYGDKQGIHFESNWLNKSIKRNKIKRLNELERVGEQK